MQCFTKVCFFGCNFIKFVNILKRRLKGRFRVHKFSDLENQFFLRFLWFFSVSKKLPSLDSTLFLRFFGLRVSSWSRLFFRERIFKNESNKQIYQKIKVIVLISLIKFVALKRAVWVEAVVDEIPTSLLFHPGMKFSKEFINKFKNYLCDS